MTVNGGFEEEIPEELKLELGRGVAGAVLKLIRLPLLLVRTGAGETDVVVVWELKD